MLEYFVKRFLSMLPKLLVITLIVFFGLEMIPGDIITRSVSPEVLKQMSEAQIEALREARGLNDPAIIRYFRWLGDLLKGDFGYSMASGTPIKELIWSRLPATVELCALAVLISSAIGILLGIVSSRHKNTLIDYTNTTFAILGSSVPEFFYALCAILIFALKLKWLPVGGRSAIGEESYFAHLKYLIMPATCMALGMLAYLMRVTRNSMLDVMNKDYVKTARAKGESERKIFYKHVFRNGCTPVMITLLGRLGLIIGGSTIIETVFNYPGMGLLYTTALNSKDVNVCMIILLFIALISLVISFLTDMVTALLDPRVRFGKEGA